jgi:hypothetical protein
MAATLIMYYEESVRAGEITYITRRMRDVVVQLNLGVSPTNADDRIKTWGVLVKTRFDSDNLHLTTRAEASATEQMSAVLQSITTTLSVFQQQICSRLDNQDKKLTRMHEAMEELGGKVNTFGEALATRAPRTPPRPPRQPALSDTSTPSAEGPETTAAAAAAATATAAAPQAMFTGPRWYPNADKLPRGMAGVSATKYYKSVLARTALATSIKDCDKGRGAAVVDCFRAVTLAEEAEVLAGEGSKEDSVAVKEIVDKLGDRVLGRMVKVYLEAGKNVPRDLAKFDDLGFNAVSDRLKQLPGEGWKLAFSNKLSADEIAKLPTSKDSFKKRKVWMKWGVTRGGSGGVKKTRIV